MVVLGIYDGTHDAGAAVVQDGVVVAASSEERYTRSKGQGGWPEHAIRECLTRVGAVDIVAYSGFVNPNPVLRGFRSAQKRFKLDDGWFYQEHPGAGARLAEWMQFESPFPHLRSESGAVRALTPALRRMLARHVRYAVATAPVELYDHHRCHAAAAAYTAPHIDTLVVIADGIGDGLALTVYRSSARGLERLAAMPYPHSYGLLYATLTGFLGFRPFRHEGKLTGLAALGDPAAVRVPFPFTGPRDARTFTEHFGAPLRPWLEGLRPYRREDVCAWLQKGLEDELGGLVAAWMARTGLGHVALAGGVFANVRLNQHIGALPGLSSLHIFPHMGDGGLAVGAALLAWATRTPGAGPTAIPHAFLGPSWDADAIGGALVRAGLPARRVQDLEEQVAARLARGQIVARFDGAMEFGPRALGNRSILAAATDRAMTDRLNVALSRSDFMPFAPVLLAEDADEWVLGLETVREAARYMTVTAQARPAFAAACPAAVHVDGSIRPQLADPVTTRSLARTVAAYRRLTGVPAIINTSFNLHEEPIVRTPEEAVATWRAARIDALAIGPYLVAV
ncbi:MAG: carbamoyltransferase C-terminal domain-containing protein [Pseudomonadota bacterium]|nr:carbamoyltransferase C-terminal domain-containing protein [Pseudomonadota bacterium]